LEDLNPLPSLQEAVENVVNGVNQSLAIDQDTQVVLGDDSGRVSLDQALANPSKFFSCDSQPQQNGAQGTGRRRPYAITFSEAALFQTDDAKLRPGAEAHLNKLARLIATNPKLRVVLTGHADRSGAPEHNLELSLWRAQAVADWLITHGHLKPEQVDVRGAGDKYPIVNNPRLFQYNRRVDITVDCSERKQ
jgi:outer membrane protein OmpA-like peptidoglycan-associated protein